MKLGNCTIGLVVVDKEGSIGHITGLTTNDSNEVIPVVTWASIKPKDFIKTAIHYHNIECLTDY